MGRMEGKASIITGAAKGIGKAIAEIFADEGSDLVLVDVDAAVIEVAREIGSSGKKVTFIEADVTKPSDVINVVNTAIAKYKKVDVLVNNAGISGGLANGLDIDDDLWHKVIDVDLNSVYLFIKHTAKEMIKNGGGSIVNMSSMLGIIGSPNSAAYHAAKGGVRTYTKAMAIVLAPYGIRVNSIHPGYIDTEMVQKVFEGLGDPQIRKDTEKLHPLGRLGTPREVACAALFLASDESSFITGIELLVDGGYTAQ